MNDQHLPAQDHTVREMPEPDYSPARRAAHARYFNFDPRKGTSMPHYEVTLIHDGSVHPASHVEYQDHGVLAYTLDRPGASLWVPYANLAHVRALG